MTKRELAKRVAADAGIPAGQAASVVDAAFDAIAGFGKFSVTERAARAGRNPATGGDPDRRQPCREVLRRRRPEAAAQQLTLAGLPSPAP